jgi:hypothetical protein
MAGQFPKGECLELTEGSFPFSVTARILRAGDDLQLYIGGGERPHIGGVAVSLPHGSLDDVSTPSCTTSVFNLRGHRDGEVAKMFADAFCRAFGRTVCASSGIHVNGANEADIERLMEVCESLLEKSLSAFHDVV